MKHVIVSVCLLVCGLAYADGYSPGYTTSAGYVLGSDGYWYYGSQAYTRALVTVPGYWSYSNCCRYWVPGYTQYQYTAYHSPRLPSYTDSAWRSKLLDIAAQRDKYEGELRRSAVEHQNYLEAVNALGLTGNFRWNGYGQSVAYGSTYLPPVNFGANANTQYGYSYNQVAANVFGQAVDPNVLYQQASQHVNNAQRLSGDAQSGFQGLVSQNGSNQARVAEILAKGQAGSQLALAILNTLSASPSTEVRGYSFKMNNGKVERIEDPKLVTPEVKGKLREQFEALAVQQCGDCHGDKDPKGGFKIGEYYTLNDEARNKVWDRITTDDLKKVMPRNKDGTPGKRLTPEQAKLFFLN